MRFHTQNSRSLIASVTRLAQGLSESEAAGAAQPLFKKLGAAFKRLELEQPADHKADDKRPGDI